MRGPAPPRILVVAAFAVLAITTALAVAGAFRTGITTDEPIHVMRLRNYFHTGWYALDWDYRGDGPGGDGTNTYVYAPVTMLVLHAWSVLWGVDGWGTVSTTPHAYDVRHLGVVVIGLVGVVAVGVIARVLLRHWQWGVVAAASLAAIPMWTGHEMFNVKDVPVATGYTLVTLGLLGLVRADAPRSGVRLARAGCLVAGLVLTLGTRPGMWPGVLTGLVVATAGIVLGSTNRRAATLALGETAAACAVAAAALVSAYPNLFGSPLRALPRTTESSSSFLDGQKSDRLYLPRHLAEEMPTLLLLFVITGAVVAVVLVARRWRDDAVTATRLALVGAQAFTLPAVAIVLGSDLYHGLRQVLFAAPAAAVLAAYGMAWGLRRPRHRLAFVGAAAALLLPVVDQLTLQPYQTTYVNLATDLVTGPFVAPDKRPGGDFWRVSLPELIEKAPLDRQLLCKAKVDKATDVAFRFTNGGEAFSTTRSLDCREESNGPLAPDGLSTARVATDDQYDAVFLKTLPTNCERRGEVTRRRHGFEVVLTVLARCTDRPPELTADPVTAADPALGTATTGDLWLFAVDGWEQWPGNHELTAPVPQATLAFTPDPACRVDGCSLVLTADAPDDLVARIGGVPVPVSRDGSAIRVAITAGHASGSQGVWLTFTRRSGGALDLRLSGLSLTTSTKGLA